MATLLKGFPRRFLRESTDSTRNAGTLRSSGEMDGDMRSKTPMLSWRPTMSLGVSALALFVGILDFALIIGAVPIPVPGLIASGQQERKDTATYSFETGAGGWTTRGAATNAVTNDVHVFAGQQALEFQVTNVSTTHQAFVYVTQVPGAQPGTSVVAHLYVPAGAPTLVMAVYALDKSYAWHSGPYPVAKPGEWTAVTYTIPQNIPKPVRELGLIIVGVAGQPPYTGPLFLDSVDLR